MSNFNKVFGALLALPEAQRNAKLERLRVVNPEGYEQLVKFMRANPGAVHEALGYEHWHLKLGPQTFTRPFAPIHHSFLEWNWETLTKLQEGSELAPDDLVAFIPWSREYGKSTIVEWAAIAEGARLKDGYVVYISGRQSQAEEHVVAIRNRIESEHVGKLYPWLGKPKMGTHGNKFGWARDFLMTSGGWAIRPVGLDVAIRGGKVLNMRPTLLIFDDIDELGDSPYVVENKERTLTRSILPMGTNNTRVLVAQNPIHENSMVNRMLTGVSMALSVRKVFGPVPAMNNFAYEIRQTEGGPVPFITQGETTWPEVTKEMWQTTLQRVGPESFESEYQHNLTIALEPRVLPEYDDRITMAHVITIDQFEAKYGHRRIPSDWPCWVGLDLGYSQRHKSAWTFLTKAPQGVDLSGAIFRYRGRTFTGTSIDDQAIKIRQELWPDERLERQFMSHEKLGERILLAQKHGWHFHPMDSAKTSGITQWRHHLKLDKSKPHPFHRDEKDALGFWKIGCPAWFDIIFDAKQLHSPTDDYGLKRHRDGAYNWRQVPVKLTDKGVTIEQPAKVDDDECFVAGTLITTTRGDVPIEEINLKDVVLTRQGWYNVLARGKTKSEAEIWTVTLNNGNRLSGTKEHPIWVAGYGWKPLSELKEGEKLLPLTEYDSTVIQTRNIGHIERILNRMYTQLGKGSKLFTLKSGRSPTGNLRKAIQFTIETTIPLTTHFPTWNLSLDRSIVATTEITCPLNSRRECEQISSVSRSWQKFGIEAQKGENGTEGTLRNQSVKLKRLCVRAITAVRNIWHDLSGINSVPTRASSDSMLVRSVKKLRKAATVYNLSVDVVPEYFANGVLVHNCDSTRGCLGDSFMSTQRMTEAQKIHSVIPDGYHVAELGARTDMDANTKHLTSELAVFLAKKGMKKTTRLVDQWGQFI